MRAVLFDLDGVITDTAKYHFKAWSDLAKKINIDIDEEFNETLKGVSREESLNRILLSANEADSYNIDEKKKLCIEKNEIYLDLINALTPNDILPGIKELIKELKSNNIKLGIASASKNAPKILESLGIKNEFDCIVNPSLLKNGKPYPEIFIKGSEILNIDINDCIGIEDSYAGIKAINAAGMTSIGVGEEDILSGCDYIVEDTSKLNYELLLKTWSKNEVNITKEGK